MEEEKPCQEEKKNEPNNNKKTQTNTESHQRHTHNTYLHPKQFSVCLLLLPCVFLCHFSLLTCEMLLMSDSNYFFFSDVHVARP